MSSKMDLGLTVPSGRSNVGVSPVHGLPTVQNVLNFMQYFLENFAKSQVSTPLPPCLVPFQQGILDSPLVPDKNCKS